MFVIEVVFLDRVVCSSGPLIVSLCSDELKLVENVRPVPVGSPEQQPSGRDDQERLRKLS